MATISSFKVWHEQNNKIKREGNNLTFSEKWILLLNTRSSPVAAEKLVNLIQKGNIYSWPVIGADDLHADNSSLEPIAYDVGRAKELGRKFIVTLNYSNDFNNINSSGDPNNNFSKASYNYGEVRTTEEFDIDPISDERIGPSNNELINPKPKRLRTLDRITIVRNERRFSAARRKKYRNRVNSVTTIINGDPHEKRSLLIESITGSPQIDSNGRRYYVVTYSVLHDPDNLHQYKYIDAATGVDLNGNYPQTVGKSSNTPTKLDGNGVYMIKADQLDPTLFIENKNFRYPEVDINQLRL